MRTEVHVEELQRHRLGSKEMYGVQRPLRSRRAARPPPPTHRQHQAEGIRLRGSSKHRLEHVDGPAESTPRAVMRAGDGDGGRGSAVAREEGGRLGMGGSGTGDGFGGVGDGRGRHRGREGATPLRKVARGFSSWPHMSVPSPVVLPADRGPRVRTLPLQSF
jgi:hypothetical protein